MPAYVAIVPGHGLRWDTKRGDFYDPGTVRATAGDALRPELREAELVRELAPVVLQHLQALGVGAGIHDAAPGDTGGTSRRSYRRRCAEGVASALGRKATACIVAHLHINAGGGSYGMAIAHQGSPGCMAVAAAVEAEIRRLAHIGKPSSAATVANFPNAGGLISAAYEAGAPHDPALKTYAVVIEPVFIDQALHRIYFVGSAQSARRGWEGTGLEALGAAIARGLAVAAGGVA